MNDIELERLIDALEEACFEIVEDYTVAQKAEEIEQAKQALLEYINTRLVNKYVQTLERTLEYLENNTGTEHDAIDDILAVLNKDNTNE